MKKDIHPKYHKNAKVICACGNTFVTGSTIEEIQTELCSLCHPFYTGNQKLVDSSRRVDKFHKKMEKTIAAAKLRKGKKVKRAKQAAAKKQTKKVKAETTNKK
ncbi:MAG: 50S ribosomal protein L31 [Patescibacteria group bacterium]